MATRTPNSHDATELNDGRVVVRFSYTLYVECSERFTELAWMPRRDQDEVLVQIITTQERYTHPVWTAVAQLEEHDSARACRLLGDALVRFRPDAYAVQTLENLRDDLCATHFTP